MNNYPSHIALPLQYQGVTTREKLPPKPEPRTSGRPFFCSGEGYAVRYKNELFIVDRNSCVHDRTPMSTRVPNKTPLQIGEKGYCCVGCEPGSWPQPIIIAHIDHENGVVGLIKPFVYIVKTIQNEGGSEYVDVKIGCDATHFENYDEPYGEFLFTREKNPELYEESDTYKVTYYDEKYVRSVGMCLTVGTFGNIDLPHENNNVTPYNFL